MKIGVDGTCWINNRGYGRHARALLSKLTELDCHNEYIIFLDSEPGVVRLPPQAGVRYVRSATPAARAASSNGHRSLRDMWRMSRALSDRELDILLFPTVYSYVPVFSRAKKIVFIHDIIAESYPQLTLPGRFSRINWKIKVTLGRLQADAILTVSEFSRRKIAEHFRTDVQRIFVVGEAGDPIFRRIENPSLSRTLTDLGLKPGQRFITYVGGFNPHKNLQALVEVFFRLADSADGRGLRLVLVGDYQTEVFHSYFDTIREQVDRLKIGDRVLFTGYLADEELVHLLNLSTVLVLPSLMEGFGLPAVEAAACGCPVIATAASPLPELLGEGALYFDPFSAQELETALRRVLTSKSLRDTMTQAGAAAAGRLNWETAARQLQQVLAAVGKTAGVRHETPS